MVYINLKIWNNWASLQLRLNKWQLLMNILIFKCHYNHSNRTRTLLCCLCLAFCLFLALKGSISSHPYQLQYHCISTICNLFLTLAQTCHQGATQSWHPTSRAQLILLGHPHLASSSPSSPVRYWMGLGAPCSSPEDLHSATESSCQAF